MTHPASRRSHLGSQGQVHMTNKWRSHHQEARRNMKVAILSNTYNLWKQYMVYADSERLGTSTDMKQGRTDKPKTTKGQPFDPSNRYLKIIRKYYTEIVLFFWSAYKQQFHTAQTGLSTAIDTNHYRQGKSCVISSFITCIILYSPESVLLYYTLHIFCHWVIRFVQSDPLLVRAQQTVYSQVSDSIL